MLDKVIRRIANWGYIVGVILILCNNIFFSHIDYSLKKTFLIPNIFVFLICIGILFSLLVCYQKGLYHVELKMDIRKLCLLLFVVQIYIFYNIYFVTETWDVATVLENARYISQRIYEPLNHAYFSSFPNNQFIVLVYAFLFELNHVLGVFDTENGLMMIIVVQCALSMMTGYFLHQILLEQTGSKGLAVFGWTIFLVLVGFSPWNVITYTDTMALFFPMATLRLYQLTKNGKYIYVKWAMIFAVSYMGYKMKPTAVIVFLAIIITQICGLLSEFRKEKIKKAVRICLLAVVVLAGCSGVFSAILHTSGLKIDKEKNVGALHMLMMGLNDENDGVWILQDVAVSLAAETKKERVAVQKGIIGERLKQYGVIGFAKHLIKKGLVIFNDGTFAWGDEGGFYDVIYENKNDVVSPLLKDIFYNGGKWYPVLSMLEHTVWFFVLLCSLGCFMLRMKDEETVILLSLIGIILFDMIFEARARYLFIYVPFFIVAGILGIQKIYCRYVYVQQQQKRIGYTTGVK